MSYAQAANGILRSDTGYNYSLWSIPCGWVIGQVPLWWSIWTVQILTKGRGYNNACPKDSWESIKDNKDIPIKVRGRIQRAIAADINTHINLPLWAAAIGIASIARVPTSTLHRYSVIFLLARIAYNFAYILIERRVYSPVRSFLYGVGAYVSLALFVKAGNQLNKLA
ncbi:hypothetical protein IAU60_003860 [Kwoniella sp. DSM 27419]